jgi:glucose/arabinose dehydrogenase
MKRLLHPTLAFGLILTAGAAAAGAQAWPYLKPIQVAGGFDLPIHVTHAGDGSGRLFVVEQPGRIRILRNGGVVAAPFLDISGRVTCCGETGLLSVAFPPGYAGKGHFYVNYTAVINGQLKVIVARYHVTANPDVADGNNEEVILTVDKPFGNHNGGTLAFGPDGYLYISFGDGGSAGDPGNRAQNPATWLGKILRIDVESGVAPYAVPIDNPFVGEIGFLPEIWGLGLRNPWRFAFDRLTGDLWIGDVGQGSWEEINLQPAASDGGENYGWRIMEGKHCFNPSTGCDQTGLTLPVAEYPHGVPPCSSVTGGTVHRGAADPALNGIYFFADYCSGRVWGLRPNGPDWQMKLLLDTPFLVSSFGEDEAGILYITHRDGGALYRLRRGIAPADFGGDGTSDVVIYRSGLWVFFSI